MLLRLCISQELTIACLVHLLTGPFVHGIYYVIAILEYLQPLHQGSLFLWQQIKVVRWYVLALQIPLRYGFA